MELEGRSEPGGAKEMEGRGTTGNHESHGETSVMSDQGRDGLMRESGGAEVALSQGRADGSEDRGEVPCSVPGGVWVSWGLEGLMRSQTNRGSQLRMIRCTDRNQRWQG